MSLKKGIRDQGLGISKQPTTNPQPPIPVFTNTPLLGIIAGDGDLPCAVASEAQKKGYTVIGIALQPPDNQRLKTFVDYFYSVHIGHFGRIIKLLKKHSVNEVVIVGKVSKAILYKDKKNLRPDLRAIKFLFSLKNYSDETFLQAVSTELKKDGIKVLETTTFTQDLLTYKGTLTRRQPNKAQWKDIEFGWKIAKEIGRLDIGQTVVVKDLAVMAVEAIEGTDETILRGGSLAQRGAVVVKVSRPQQDMRLDVPVVGIDTLNVMKKTNAEVLAIEVGKSIIVDREKFIKEADKAGIAVVGVNPVRKPSPF